MKKNIMIATAAVLTGALTYGAYDYNETRQFVESEVECLTQNIYHEARGESVQGQVAVAYVTVNRRDHDYFPNTVCDVVWDRGQFSWTNDGVSDDMNNEEAYRIARNIAEWVYDGKEEDPTDGALFYHADYANPSWNQAMEVSVVIDKHIFYNWDGRW